MRDIKFRAIDTHGSNEMMYFDLTNVPPMSIYSEIMQYTRLKDKNGKEVFEADIVKVTLPFKMEKPVRIHQVIYIKGRWQLRDKSLSRGLAYDLHEVVCFNDQEDIGFFEYVFKNVRGKTRSYGNIVEIIGNIYENKELLNEGASL